MKNIHIIATDKPSRLSDCHNGNLHLDDVRYLRNYQNIYITSDEEIKESDWCIDNRNTLNKIINVSTNGYLMFENSNSVKTINCKKIILTTDQNLIKDGVQPIDDEFLEWFVKNSSCEFVKIGQGYFKNDYDLSYKIIIPEEETLESKLNKIVSKEPSKFWKESDERQSQRIEQLIELLKQTTEYEVSQKFRDKVNNYLK